MKILVASDHAGFELKDKLISYLKNIGHEPVDMGPFKYDAEDDYPDFIKPVAEEVSKDPENAKAIILGGSGQGEAMVANRHPHVRAIVFYGAPEGDLSILRLGKEHNNSNVLSLGARFLTEDDMQVAVSQWLNIPFSGEERHVRRIAKLDN